MPTPYGLTTTAAQAGGTATAAGAAGTVSAGAAGGPVGLAIAATIAIVGGALGYAKRKKARRAARDALALDARVTFANRPIPVAYGYCKVAAPTVWAGANSHLPDWYAPGSADTVGSMIAGEGSRNRYLMAQAVLGVGEWEEVAHAWASGKKLVGVSGTDKDKIRDAAMLRYRYSEAEPAATAFTGGAYSPSQTLRDASWYNWGDHNPSVQGNNSNERGANSTFTGLSYVTAAFKWDTDKPPFSQVPVLEVAGKGKKIKSITKSGNTYALSSTRTFERSMPLILLDYLLDVCGVSVDSIDLKAFYDAHQIAKVVVQGLGVTDTSDFITEEVWNSIVPDVVANPWTTTKTWGNLRSVMGIPVGDSGVIGEADINLLRYEFNGSISTADTYEDGITRILSVAPGAVFFAGLDGKYKLVLPQPKPSTITVDDDWLIGPPQVLAPTSQTRLNQIEGAYPSLGKDFAEDSITYPEVGSKAEATLLAEDQQVRLAESLALPGVMNPYHATDIAATEILRTRREQYQLSLGARGIVIEPGDTLHFSSVESGFTSRNVLVEEVRVTGDLRVEVRGRRHEAIDYTFITHELDSLSSLVVPDTDPGRPASLSVSNDGGLIQVVIAPNANESDLTIGYVVERQFTPDKGSAGAWQSVGQIDKSAPSVEETWPTGGTLKYRALAVDAVGRRSDWRESSDFTFQTTFFRDGVGRELVYAATADSVTSIPSNRQPKDAWKYLQPGTAGGLTWRTSPPDATSTTPKIWWAWRKIEGDPAAGDTIGGNWSTPAVTSALGEKGDKGDKGDTGAAGSPGSSGSDGEDAAGLEFIFTSTTRTGTPSSPSNSWGYNSPGSGWATDAPDATTAKPKVWWAQRKIVGSPSSGASVSDTWTSPAVLSTLGETGATGATGAQGNAGRDGSDGEAAGGYEHIYTVTNGSTPASPLNSWGFDSPGTTGGTTWYDGAPAVNATNNTLWWASRKVVGTPNTGASVSDTWSSPVVLARYGADGSAGVAGQDGDDASGFEYIYTLTDGTTPASPSNNWGYDSPGTISGTTWYDGAPSPTDANDVIWWAARAVTGTPSVGASVPATWSSPTVLSRRGKIGATGAQGPQGPQGPAGIPVIGQWTVGESSIELGTLARYQVSGNWYLFFCHTAIVNNGNATKPTNTTYWTRLT